jgi:hypothetical protein
MQGGVLLPARMAGMPELQEQFPAARQDGGYAGTAGAISGGPPWMAVMLETREQFPAGESH